MTEISSQKTKISKHLPKIEQQKKSKKIMIQVQNKTPKDLKNK